MQKQSPEEVWLVGFTVPWLNGIEHMSGLVDILDIQINSEHRAAIFVVRNLDQSGTLFQKGLLRATKVKGWRGEKQGIVVDCPADRANYGATSLH